MHCTACPLKSVQFSGGQHTHSSSRGDRQLSPLSDPRGFLSPQRETLYSHALPLSPQPQATTNLFSVWIRLCGHFTSVGLHSPWPFTLASLTEHSVFEIQPRCACVRTSSSFFTAK